MEHLVPATRLEEMMSELHQALDREKQSQRLLSDQSLQVKELTRQLNCEASDRSHNEQSVKFAMKVNIYIFSIRCKILFLYLSLNIL